MENTKTDIIKNFVPSWFSVVMGTSIIPVALNLNKNIVPFFHPLAQVFFILSIAVFVAILIPWVLRFFKHFENVKSDFSHPVLASFFPTFGTAVMILAIDFMLLGKDIFGENLSINISVTLFAIGSISILILGFIIFPTIFMNNKINLSHGNFGWFIPAVSHMFIPLVGLDLVSRFKKTPAGDFFFVVSMFGLGIGLILFIYIACAVFHRYLYHEPLAPKLASTFFIGMVPPALITTICVKMTKSIYDVSFSDYAYVIAAFSKIISLVTWGFAMWWFIIASIVIINHAINSKLPYALSWWALTFPMGALTVSTGSISKLFNIAFFDYLLTGLIVIMLGIWAIVAVRTLMGIKDRSVFEA